MKTPDKNSEKKQNGNDNNNNGNDDNGNATGTTASSSDSSSAASGGLNSSGSGGEAASGNGSGDGKGRSGGEQGGVSASDSRHGVDDSSDNAGTAGTGNSGGSGKRRGRPVGSRNKPAGSEENAPVVEENILGRTPRKVKDVGVTDEPLTTVPLSTRELIASVYSGLYWSVGQLTSLPQVWELDDNQETALANATEAMIKSLGKRKATRTLKAINEYFPGISLVITALVITVPRIQMTSKVHNVKRVESNARREAARQAAAAAGINAAPGGINSDDGRNVNANAGHGARPVTAADFAEFGG